VISRRRAILALTLTALSVVGVGVILLLPPDGKQQALADAPGMELMYAGGKLVEVDNSNAILGASAYQLRGYATDAEPGDIVAYFDPRLAKFGYQPTEPTRSDLTRFEQYQPLRQYQNGAFAYRLFLLPAPYRLSRNEIITGYRHVLFTQLSN
jgi:hypothetical protein